MKPTGKITQWLDDKGYGFISPDGEGQRVFVHIKAFKDQARRPVAGDLVWYRLSADDQGRPRAEDVVFVGSATTTSSASPQKKPARTDLLRRRRPRGWSPSAVLLVVFTLGLLAVAVAGELSWWIPAAYLVLSSVTFAVYAVDKAAAQDGKWRTPENTLHLLDLIGGWPGGLVAQIWLRHKSSKFWFRVKFWITVLVNCGALVMYKLAGSGFF